MKHFCHHCGKEVENGNKFCPYCGALQDRYSEDDRYEEAEVVDEPKPAGKKTIINESTKRDLDTVVKILMIIITVLTGFAIIPLLWTVPMTITACDRIKKKEPYGLVLSICTLLFMAIAPGIIMIIRDADTYTD